MLRWSRKEVEVATETPCLKPYSKFTDRPTVQTEAGILRNGKVLSSKSRSRQPTVQCMSALLNNIVLPITYKSLLLTYLPKPEAKQNKNTLSSICRPDKEHFPLAVSWLFQYKGILWSLTDRSFTLLKQKIAKCRSETAQSQLPISFPLTFNLSNSGWINPSGKFFLLITFTSLPVPYYIPSKNFNLTNQQLKKTAMHVQRLSPSKF